MVTGCYYGDHYMWCSQMYCGIPSLREACCATCRPPTSELVIIIHILVTYSTVIVGVLRVLPVRPSVCLSVCYVRAPNSQTKGRRKTKTGVNFPQGRSRGVARNLIWVGINGSMRQNNHITKFKVDCTGVTCVPILAQGSKVRRTAASYVGTGPTYVSSFCRCLSVVSPKLSVNACSGLP